MSHRGPSLVNKLTYQQRGAIPQRSLSPLGESPGLLDGRGANAP